MTDKKLIEQILACGCDGMAERNCANTSNDTKAEIEKVCRDYYHQRVRDAVEFNCDEKCAYFLGVKEQLIIKNEALKAIDKVFEVKGEN